MQRIGMPVNLHIPIIHMNMLPSKIISLKISAENGNRNIPVLIGLWVIHLFITMTEVLSSFRFQEISKCDWHIVRSEVWRSWEPEDTGGQWDFSLSIKAAGDSKGKGSRTIKHTCEFLHKSFNWPRQCRTDPRYQKGAIPAHARAHSWDLIRGRPAALRQDGEPIQMCAEHPRWQQTFSQSTCFIFSPDSSDGCSGWAQITILFQHLSKYRSCPANGNTNALPDQIHVCARVGVLNMRDICLKARSHCAPVPKHANDLHENKLRICVHVNMCVYSSVNDGQ